MEREIIMSVGTMQRKSDIYNTYGSEDKLVFTTAHYAELLSSPSPPVHPGINCGVIRRKGHL
jgi:hypothetical protein